MHSLTISFNFPVSATLPFWFLVVSLFVPRLALLVMWLQHQFVPSLLGIIAAVLLPRVLILFLIYTQQGLSGWFLVHLIGLLLAFGSGGNYYRRRRANDL